MQKLDSIKLRQLYITFFEQKDHKSIPAAPLVLSEDPTTLFTSSGMQQLVNNLAGEMHPAGKRLCDIQPCFRANDVEEVGDNRHTTFFEMMGNWSLGDYFKEQQIPWMWELFTRVVGLPKEKLYVTTFEGCEGVPEDKESFNLWQSLGVPTDHIFSYGARKNWWSRSGTPDQMPVGEIGGPSTELFYEFSHITHDPVFGPVCHPNCDCGRFLEIGNSVFIQYRKSEDGTLSQLPQKNVDFGGGLVRTLAAFRDDPDIFTTDIFAPVIACLEKKSGTSYHDARNTSTYRIIADHINGALFMIAQGTVPGNKAQSYIVRRLIRRTVVKLLDLNITDSKAYEEIAKAVWDVYDEPYLHDKDFTQTVKIFQKEVDAFQKTIHEGRKRLSTEDISGKMLFDLYQSHGFPLEVAQELLHERGIDLTKQVLEDFEDEKIRHQNLSRSASSGMFKGGLADHSEQVTKYHTATHLVHQALHDVLGESLRQEGSNITGERLRFDFSCDKAVSEDDIKKVSRIVEEKIAENLPITFEVLPKQLANTMGARSFFKDKYGDEVKVYFIGGDSTALNKAYSKEFCGGPHVQSTGEIGTLAITKWKKIGGNMYRIYAQ